MEEYEPSPPVPKIDYERKRRSRSPEPIPAYKRIKLHDYSPNSSPRSPRALQQQVQPLTRLSPANNSPIRYSPTRHSPTRHSPTSHSPTRHSPVKQSPLPPLRLPPSPPLLQRQIQEPHDLILGDDGCKSNSTNSTNVNASSSSSYQHLVRSFIDPTNNIYEKNQEIIEQNEMQHNNTNENNEIQTEKNNNDYMQHDIHSGSSNLRTKLPPAPPAPPALPAPQPQSPQRKSISPKKNTFSPFNNYNINNETESQIHENRDHKTNNEQSNNEDNDDMQQRHELPDIS